MKEGRREMHMEDHDVGEWIILKYIKMYLGGI
jgi:hypothetical protein